MKENNAKKNLFNHILKNGKKQISEKTLKNCNKLLQKSQKKSHNEILKQAILNTTSTFRIISLKKRKGKVEIPVFLSSITHRTSWGIKSLVKTVVTSKQSNALFKQLKSEIESSFKAESETIKTNEELQKQILQKKKYFKYYKW
jgi:ribosomal protein S7